MTPAGRMNDDEIRLLIRNAIARHLGSPTTGQPVAATPPAPVTAVPISFARYPLARDPDDVMCVIEPAVPCNHCGYCQCHGH